MVFRELFSRAVNRWKIKVASQLAEEVGSTATLGCALLTDWQKTQHRQECLCYHVVSGLDFMRKRFSR
jgi:hypothetical protein